MEKTKIEWCDSSWNPVTGCLHDCPYCYARGIAKRFGGLDGTGSDGLLTLSERRSTPYPAGFMPTLHRYRLEEPMRKTKPRTIFVGSMTDLFGEWVSSSWISEVMEACLAAPQHRYLFLTKNPARYIKLENEGLLPKQDNFWYGSTTTDGDTPAFWSGEHNTFVSIEPILEPFNEGHVVPVKWVILGAETGNRKDKVIPKRSWIESVVSTCEAAGVPVFMKNSLKPIWGEDIITEFPW